jgi:hypothetical protein
MRAKKTRKKKGGRPGDYNPEITQHLQEIQRIIIDEVQHRLQRSMEVQPSLQRSMDVVFLLYFQNIGQNARALLETTTTDSYSRRDVKIFIRECVDLIQRISNHPSIERYNQLDFVLDTLASLRHLLGLIGSFFPRTYRSRTRSHSRSNHPPQL